MTIATDIDTTAAFGGDFTRQCPICLGPRLSSRYGFADFNVLACDDCGHSWRSNMYGREKLEQIYCSEDYEHHPYFDRKREDEDTAANPRFADYRRGFERIEALVGKGRLLDVGSGSGSVLSMGKKRGWQCAGVEMSPGLGRATAEELGVPVHVGTFEEAQIAPGSLQAITFWDVIEHVVDPVSVLRKARRSLADGGVALFCTPDEHSMLARIGRLLYGVGYRYPALALHPPNHTYFFNRQDFRTLLRDNGLEPVQLYSQQAFFDHSPLASRVQKLGIGAIETAASLIDRRYEMVVLARAV